MCCWMTVASKSLFIHVKLQKTFTWRMRHFYTISAADRWLFPIQIVEHMALFTLYLRRHVDVKTSLRLPYMANSAKVYYVYAVVSLAAESWQPFRWRPHCDISVSVGSVCVRVWKRDCDVTSLVEHRVKSLQQNGPWRRRLIYVS